MKLEKCALCWTWAWQENITDGKDNNGNPVRKHLMLDYCVAALADRVGDESIDDAVVRLYGKPMPAEDVDFVGKEKDVRYQ